jgi:hypothetical protein
VKICHPRAGTPVAAPIAPKMSHPEGAIQRGYRGCRVPRTGRPPVGTTRDVPSEGVATDQPPTVEDPTFPRPTATLGMRIWDRNAVVKWVTATGREAKEG